ncbi:MAG: helix-turn-helix domain-containing protein [Bacillota bacterium]
MICIWIVAKDRLLARRGRESADWFEEAAVNNRINTRGLHDGDRRESLQHSGMAILTQYPQVRQIIELFDHLEDVMAWIKDREGRFCWVNRTSLMMQTTADHESRTGDGSHGILGKTDHDLAPAFLADQYRLDDEQVLAGGRIVNRIEPFRRPDGTTGWHVTNKIPLFGNDGEVIGSAGIAQWLHTPSLDLVPGQEFAPVLAYMRDHYRSHISNQQLARLAHMSVRAFERRFYNGFQLTPQKYLKNLRMRIASHALVYTSQLLADVATNCGFADQSHFTREFRRHFGRTPGEYREYFAKQATIAGPGTKNAAAKQAQIGPKP